MDVTAGPARAEQLLSGLTEAQREAVTSTATPLCIVAAAGAGKTRVLTRRIAYRCATGTADAQHSLALTFTRKAAGELQQRLAASGLRSAVAAGTFHAHAAAQLQRWWADRRQKAPAMLERKSRLLGPLAADRPGLARVPLSDLGTMIEWAKARDVGPAGFVEALAAAGRAVPGGVEPSAVAALYERYENEKRRRGLIDFDDLLAGTASAIESDPAFAGAQRWRWRHIYVDEFQDLNPLQYRLLMAWLGPSVDLCVVGDPHQAIYGWNGADPSLLATFAARWPTASVVRLDANHRCTREIVRAAAAVLGPSGATLTAGTRTGAVPAVWGLESDRAEARAIAAGLVRAHGEGRPWGSMAVLTRTNAQLPMIQEALTAARVPWWSAASAALLDEPEVRATLATLRSDTRRPLQMALADLREELGRPPSVGSAPTPPGPVGPASARPNVTGVGSTSAGSTGAGSTGAGSTGAGSTGAGSTGAGPTGAGSTGAGPTGAGPTDAVSTSSGSVGAGFTGGGSAGLTALVDAGVALLTLRPDATVGDWLSWLPATARDRSDHRSGAPDTVTLSSFHRAKGLEWPLVWVAGVEEGLVPLGRATSPAVLDEERRLLYVALTRAVDELHISWAATRTYGSAAKPVPRRPSRWLDAVVTALEAERADSVAPPAGEWRARLSRQRAQLRESAERAGRPAGRHRPANWPAPDEQVRSAVVAWRLEAARHSGVPPQVLLHDVTVDALAALRPATMDELLTMPGFGPVKAARYGPVLLDILADRAQSA
ncbi:MAG TPA: ATP-dependent DNA helicase UvrD2 [Acidimicrobiales bacterium]|nr:ATP-dependent DNA helicase UvrD2 [Acidimicrobiales bacterium]